MVTRILLRTAFLAPLFTALLGHATAAHRAESALRVPPRTGVDSFAVRFSGLPEGRHVFSLQPTSTGFEYREEFTLGTQLRRAVTIDLSPSLEVRSHQGEGAIFGQDTRVSVRYTNHRAQGCATIAGPQGPRTVAIDTVLPPGAFDGQALFPTILSSAWRIGDDRTLTIFDIDEQNLTRQRLRVVAREELTVPAGRFAALRAELSTTQLPVTIWVTEAEPHRLLKVASSNGETVLLP